MREKVVAARTFQQARTTGMGAAANGELSGAALRKTVNLNREAASLLENAFEALGISMRAYDRMLKLARTIADVEASETVEAEHVAEAIQYRRLDNLMS
jgi:magnesium chelatase family protein